MKKMYSRFILLSFLLIATVPYVSFAQKNQTFQWQAYENVEEVGFAQEELSQLKNQLGSTKTAALLVIYKGHVLFSYGDNTRKFMLHSIRKSMMNALIGREVASGTLRLDATLADLQIDDIGKLTTEEKKATLKDLLSSRSGIFHPAAYSPRGMAKNLPERGSHTPGTFWYYNNWDFNTLLTIYERQSGKRFFEAFTTEIAQAIGMEDFELEDNYYRHEPEKSIHPAYLMRMSSRDMARFGLLYLNEGAWANQQLLSSEWIQQSTSAVTDNLPGFDTREGYGMLWWTATINNKNAYYASGSGGQRILVLPEDDMIIVHRANTYENRNVSDAEVNQIIETLLVAKKKEVSPSSATLKPYKPKKKVFEDVYHGSMDQYLGTYRHKFLGNMTIQKEKGGYYLKNNIGTFRLYVTNENTFMPVDIETPMVMEQASEGHNKFTIETRFDKNRRVTHVVFYY
ncbi:serine hydrolase [Aureisphaera galaxeae]|uniref:serine hydrolase domain-containing protein n=1 Tax=Aureisphaera galaxeae TaxID=1538023 RepID=UPI00234FD648|nr:serine hydrolase [Aureisphaera galaxeae]MDC8004701.1 serine hydrolase [Aureisphaera galaxeae]